MQRCGIAALCGDPAQLQRGREIVRLRGKQLLDQLLEVRLAMLIPLAFHFRGKLINRPEIARIQFHCLTQLVDCSGGVATVAFEQSLKVEQAIIVFVDGCRTVESLGSHIEVALAQRQDPPIHPARRLTWNQIRRVGKAAFRANVVANLQSSQAHIECRSEI